MTTRAPSLTTASVAGPPRTYGAVVRQARDAFRRFRADKAAGCAPKQDPGQPWRLSVRLPVPVPPGFDLLARQAPPPLLERGFGVADESDFPGGQVQRFRQTRPLVEALLEGYSPKFVGMLEAPEDGVGCWALQPERDTTLVANVCNATFEPFARLCAGEFGGRPLQPDHTLVLVNSELTGSRDIGQFWDRQLKARARELVDEAEWQTLYSVELVRTSRGKRHGLLVGAWGSGWRLYAAASEENAEEQPLHSSAGPIPPEEAVRLLNAG